MKHKTVKDFIVTIPSLDGAGGPIKIQVIDAGIKAEAIKWVRKWENDTVDEQVSCPDVKEGCLVFHTRKIRNLKSFYKALGLREFHNITEEDLE